jgi:DNA-binding LytR/AlgR family response regulator
MIIEAIAIDDELPALRLLQHFCERLDFIHLQKTFNRPAEGRKYLQTNPVQLLFLDVNMPSLLGTELYKSLQQPLLVIFTTAHSEYAVEGFNLNALDYLLKPFTFERFVQAVEKAKARLISSASSAYPQLVFKVDYGLTQVNSQDILYVEGLDDYLKIYLHQQQPLIIRMTMKALLEKLPAQTFARVHRSYIVPLQRIELVKNKTILIAGREIPIGNSYEAAFFNQFGQ